MDLNKNTLSTQIYQILRNDILTRQIPLGEKLTLKNLQLRFQVSSTPIRDALTRLNEEGLVEYYSNIGVNVISLTEQDLIELYEFMGDLDSLSIIYASGHEDQKALIDELEANIQFTRSIMEHDLELSEMNDWICASDRFHLIFYDYCSNSRLTAAAERLRSQLTIYSNSYETNTETQRKIYKEHHRIYEAYCSSDYQKAASAMKEHLRNSLQYVI